MMLNRIDGNVVAGQADPSPAPGCPSLPPGETGAGVAKAVCSVGGWGEAVTNLPSWLWHLAVDNVADNRVRIVWWALLAVVLGVACYTWRRWLWRRAVGRGSWLEVVPPRETAVTASTAVWRLLSPLARRAGSGPHLVHPPLTVEIHGDGRGRLAVAVWAPKWVPTSVLATEVRRAWPGALVRPFVPTMADQAFKAAGFKLAVHSSDHEMLVEEVYLRSRLAASVSPAGDPLRAVFDAVREQGGPTVLQILAKPATTKRIAKLAQAARQPVKPHKPLMVKGIDVVWSIVAGGLRFVLDLFTGSTRSGHAQQGSQHRPPDPLQRLAMRKAADKLGSGPHLLVAIRSVALRPDKGWAVADASSLANGYRVAAFGLRPRRLWWARSAVSDRWAHRGEWLLATCSELGVLFHLPADPALFGFTVAAASRPFPHQASRLRPEQAADGEPGWSRGKWTGSSGATTTALAMRDHNSEGSDGSAEAEFFDPWGMPLSGDTNPHSENNHFIDDDIDSDWDH